MEKSKGTSKSKSQRNILDLDNFYNDVINNYLEYTRQTQKMKPSKRKSRAVKVELDQLKT